MRKHKPSKVTTSLAYNKTMSVLGDNTMARRHQNIFTNSQFFWSDNTTDF